MNRFYRRCTLLALGTGLALSLSSCAGFLVGGAASISVVHDRRTTGTVIDDQTLFDLGDAISVEDLVFTADPFCDAVA